MTTESSGRGRLKALKKMDEKEGRRRRRGRGDEEERSNKMLSPSRKTANALLALLALIVFLTISDTQIAKAQTSLLNSLYLPSSSSFSNAKAPNDEAQLLKRDLSQSSSRAKRSNVCQVNDGESVAIVEIEESRNSDMSQSTFPLELPISGSVALGEIELKIESETHKYFQIEDKSLKLTRPLDRDAVLKENSTTQIAQQPISSIYLQISCLDKRQLQLDESQTEQRTRKVIIPVLVKVLDLNDNAPKFSMPVYTVQVDELAPVGSVVIDYIKAVDLDSANNGLVEYSLVAPASTKAPQRLIERAQPQLQTTTPPTSSEFTTTTSTTASYLEPKLMTTTQSIVHKISSPTINLQSEPIMNGPMEEGEDEEESDETLLASMSANSTDSEPDSSDSDSMVLMLPKNSGGRKKRDIKHRTATTIIDEPSSSKDLWTNLMSAGEGDTSTGQQQFERLTQPDEDASEYFVLELAANSNRPVIKLKKQLDYESRRVHVFTVMATDMSSNRSERQSSTATVRVKVLDGDDQGPAFMLDQTGCATGSLPSGSATTPISPDSKHTVGRRELRSEEEQFPSSQQQQNLPKGFKVSDENFEFSDVNEPEDIEPSLARTRRVPLEGAFLSTSAPARTSSKYQLPDYSCLSSSPASSEASGQAEYFSTVMSGDSDYLIRLVPQQIKARDRDELNAPIRYSFINGTPSNYSLYFQINPLDASIKQVAPIDKNQISSFVIWVQAQEQSANKLASVAKLTIEVVPADKNPPVLVPNSYVGYVEENSAIGTFVFLAPSNKSSLMRINVLDEDYSTGVQQQASSARNAQLYEFETTSDSFKVNKEGFVYVNKWPLDRDPPSQSVHMFQVTARQIGLTSSRSISSPISMNITLLDLNDNPPSISNSSLTPIQLPASNRVGGFNLLRSIRVLDKDSAENARVSFSIYHVSNNGKERFRINEESGELEAIGKFSSGEQFSLTIQVTDELQRSSQAILEVFVVPGPNTGGPQFIVNSQSVSDSSLQLDNSRGYAVEINEGIAPHSAVIQVRASDPENDPISYAIVDGNVNSDFYINSKTGVVYVANKLDREEVSAYHLLVQARDSGGLATNRPLKITISDNNDENPTFDQSQYMFSIEEGVSGKLLGRVSAHDGDENENGRIRYKLSGEVPTFGPDNRPVFSINELTGDLTVMEELDYERTKSFVLLVTAQDQGEKPRSTTTSVLVKVIDVQDEDPYFERYYIESKLAENLANFRVAQVQARDLDSVPQISYVMKSGDASLFSVDPESGIVSTIRGLDFEESKTHTILIGTNEKQDFDLVASANKLAESLSSTTSQQLENEKFPICRIDVAVLDVNDNAPQFVSQPLPVRIQDSAQLGTVVTKLFAEDRDGSERNNQIRYELVTSENAKQEENVPVTSDKCAHSFMIDATSGAISIKSDLKRDAQSECVLYVRAKDSIAQQQSQLGSQQLSSLTSITIFIDHIAEISPASMIGFADTSFTVELEENSPANSLVKVLPIVNKPKISFPLSCEIVSGNELGKFYVLVNENRDCELRTRDPSIDFELKQRYTLTLRLNTIGSSPKSVAQVNVNVLDKNDNRPMFHQPARYSHLTQGKFLAAITSDAPSDLQVLQLRASDPDSAHSNGLVSYELLNDNELEGRFKVDLTDGIVRTSRPVEDIPSTRLPLRLKVMARDNPEEPSEALSSTAEILLNLIDDRHRIALVLRDSPAGKVLDSKEELLSAIQERTNLIAGLEKAESLKIFRNGSLESDVSGTDFWFYLIEPGSFRIVPSDDLRVRSNLFEQKSQNSLLDVVKQTLGFDLVRVRPPYSLTLHAATLSSFSRSFGANGQSIASLLILIALFIAITSAIVVIYQCGFWSSYSAARAMSINEKLYNFPNQYYQCPSANFPKGAHSLTATSQDQYAFRSAFSTLNPNHSLMPQLINDQRNVSAQKQLAEPIYHLETPAASQQAAYSKEYETQMLKMPVLFDDSNSLDEQNLNSNFVSKNLN